MAAKKSGGKRPGTAKKKPAMPGVSCDEKRWQAEEDMRTIRRAEEIKNDPKRLAAARKIAADEVKALSKIAKK